MQIRPSQSLALQQTQKLLMTPKMEQAFHVLKMPLCELGNWVTDQITENPLLEEVSSTTGWKNSVPDLPAKISLYEHLVSQVGLRDFDKEEREIAHLIIGNLDHRGFLDLPIEQVAPSFPLKKVKGMLKKVQELDPAGVGAKNLAESLLLQLRQKGKEQSVGYTLVESHFDDLLHRRWNLLEKGLQLSKGRLQEVIDLEIASLDLAPGARFSTEKQALFSPDVIVEQEGESLRILINQEGIPSFQISPLYEEYQEAGASPDFLSRQLSSAKWVDRVMKNRTLILEQITQILVKREGDFFRGAPELTHSFTLKEISEEIGRCESTIGRALQGKTLLCSRGVFPMKAFFCSTLRTEGGNKVSSRSAKVLIKELIQTESRSSPFSDERLAEKLGELGAPCARRTVAKYRKELSIPSARSRKH